MSQENIHVARHTNITISMFSHLSKEEGRGNRSGENYIVRSLLVCTNYQIFRVITAKRITWEGHVARMGRGEGYSGFCWGNMRGKGTTWKIQG